MPIFIKNRLFAHFKVIFVYLYFYTFGFTPYNEVDIIDRWGVLVWRAKRYNNRDIKFIGKSNQGHPSKLSDDIYYYVIRFYDENGELNIFKGSLQLKSGISEH